jgi:hypothetical protein
LVLCGPISNWLGIGWVALAGVKGGILSQTRARL